MTASGRGIVTASFVPLVFEGTPFIDIESTRYDFMPGTGPGTEPVPEPTTLLLFGSGLAAALRYRKATR
jgi:hypothetical protein